MAIGDNYITTSELKDYMSIQGTQYDARITSVCAAVSREVEDHCHRQFNQDAAVSTRLYNARDCYVCVVDDIATSAGLLIKTDNDDDGVYEITWASSDYELRPLNSVRNGRTGWPFWEIRAVGRIQQFRNTRHANVQVTAQWGWPAVPAEVKEACLMLGADTFQMKDSRLGIAGADQFGTVVRVRDSVVAKEKLKHFVRQKAFVA